ncbi:MAG: radical SAM family heme chaperone HemW [Eubacteriales bacterium]
MKKTIDGESSEKTLGLYLHIPFCAKKCNYCDFVSLPCASENLIEKYVQSLCRHLDSQSVIAEGYTVDTVYIGGGTPTLISSDKIAKILEVVLKKYKISTQIEISCECNPATIDADGLRSLRSAGVNRLSIGFQSAHDAELARLGRIHNCDDFLCTYSNSVRAGFDNISVDVMYGIPLQTPDSFAQTLSLLCSLSPAHISAYCLRVEPDTLFGKMGDSLVLPDDDVQADMYLMCSDILRGAGYKKYEISNFSKPGRESRHNLRYWLGEEYLGFGAAAHSYFGGERFRISENVASYAAGECLVPKREKIDAKALQSEYVMLRMRLARGIEFADFRRRFGADFPDLYPQIERYSQMGYIIKDENGCRFSDRGFFVSNAILSDLVDFS